MRVDLLIRGQGLAGTLLAWELERAGVSFAIVDRGHAGAATMAAAGIINPITGRRLVKSWRVDTLLPLARETYRALEAGLGISVWHDMRIRRLFADDREREAFAQKFPRGEWGSFASAADDAGFWIEGAARVDLEALLQAARARWLARGALVGDEAAVRAERIIDCTGMGAVTAVEWGGVPWEFSHGEMLELAVEGLAPGVILNRRHWIVPVGAGRAWVGATHEPGVRAPREGVGRAALEASARELLGARPFAVVGRRAGVRVNLPDKRPVAGWHPTTAGLGIVNGLGAKGALWAPWLARQWVEHVARGASFDAATDVARFFP